MNSLRPISFFLIFLFFIVSLQAQQQVGVVPSYLTSSKQILSEYRGKIYLTSFEIVDSLYVYEYINGGFEQKAAFPYDYDPNFDEEDVAHANNGLAWLNDDKLTVLKFSSLKLYVEEKAEVQNIASVQSLNTDGVLLFEGGGPNSTHYLYQISNTNVSEIRDRGPDNAQLISGGYLSYDRFSKVLAFTRVFGSNSTTIDVAELRSEGDYQVEGAEAVYVNTNDEVLVFNSGTQLSQKLDVELTNGEDHFVALDSENYYVKPRKESLLIISRSDGSKREVETDLEVSNYMYCQQIGGKLILSSKTGVFELDMQIGSVRELSDSGNMRLMPIGDNHVLSLPSGHLYDARDESYSTLQRWNFMMHVDNLIKVPGSDNVLFIYRRQAGRFKKLIKFSPSALTAFEEVDKPQATVGTLGLGNLFSHDEKVWLRNPKGLYVLSKDGMHLVSDGGDLLLATGGQSNGGQRVDFITRANDGINWGWRTDSGNGALDAVNVNIEESPFGVLLGALHNGYYKAPYLYLTKDLFTSNNVALRIDEQTRKVTNMGPMRFIQDQLGNGEVMYYSFPNEIIALMDDGRRVVIDTEDNKSDSRAFRWLDGIYCFDGHALLDITDPIHPEDEGPSLGISGLNYVQRLTESVLLLKTDSGDYYLNEGGMHRADLDDAYYYSTGASNYVASKDGVSYWVDLENLSLEPLPANMSGKYIMAMIPRERDTLLVCGDNVGSKYVVEYWKVEGGQAAKLFDRKSSAHWDERWAFGSVGEMVLAGVDRDYFLIDSLGEWFELDHKSEQYPQIASDDSGFYFIAQHPTLGNQVYYLPGSSDPNSTHEPIPLSTSPLTIYPNPASTHITIACPDCPSQPIRYEILSSDGHAMSQGSFSPDETINIARLPTGAYIITIHPDQLPSLSASFIKL